MYRKFHKKLTYLFTIKTRYGSILYVINNNYEEITMPTIKQLKQDMNNELEEMKQAKDYAARRTEAPSGFREFIGKLRERAGYPEPDKEKSSLGNDTDFFKNILDSPNKPLNDKKETIFHIVPKINNKIDHPLVVYCMEKALEIASLEQGEHDTHVLNAEDKDGFTPLHHMAYISDKTPHLTRIYFEQAQKNNCDLNPTSSKYGSTPLHAQALSKVRPDTIKVIMQYSHLNIEDNASLNNILEKGADQVDLNAASKICPHPPALLALIKGNNNAAEKLLNAGANFDFKFKEDGESPLECLDTMIDEQTQTINNGRADKDYLDNLQKDTDHLQKIKQKAESLKQKAEPDLQTSEAANTVQKLSILEEFQKFGGDEPTESSQFKNRF